MKVAVFLDRYRPYHEWKDGNVVLGLREAGATATLVTLDKPELRTHDPPYPVVRVDRRRLASVEFWQSLNVDAVLAYTWLNARYNALLRCIRRAGPTLLVRADSDGRIGPPVEPRWFERERAWTVSALPDRARRAAWRIVPAWMARRRLAHIGLTDAVYLESPQGRANLERFLARWQRPDLVDRITHIPVAISERFIRSQLSEKTPRVLAVGRWEDERQKNTATAARVLRRFLERRPDYEAVIVGSGARRIEAALRGLGAGPTNRLQIAGVCPHDAMVSRYGNSRTLFMPSHWEGFPLAAAEALCMGCSTVGTPIEALRFASDEGRSGTVAASFSETDLLDALVLDAQRWESGHYEAAAIAASWRARFERRVVGRQILELAVRARDGARGH